MPDKDAAINEILLLIAVYNKANKEVKVRTRLKCTPANETATAMTSMTKKTFRATF